MPWAKLDDGYHTNHKIARADLPTMSMHTASIAYCAKALTDGFVPEQAVLLVAGMAKVRDVEATVAQLVELRLWDVVDGGYAVHDYLEYNPSRAKAEHTREVRAEAGSKGGKQRASNLLGNQEAEIQPRIPYPVNENLANREIQPESYMCTADAPHARAQDDDTVLANGHGRAPPWPNRAWAAAAFDESFWPHFKRKTNKARGRDAYVRLLLAQPSYDAAYALAQQIMEVVIEQFKQWTDLARSPQAESYIHGRRWEDEHIIPTGPAGGGAPARRRGTNQ